VSQYQKKHSPTHHPDHAIFISFFHLLWSTAMWQHSPCSMQPNDNSILYCTVLHRSQFCIWCKCHFIYIRHETRCGEVQHMIGTRNGIHLCKSSAQIGSVRQPINSHQNWCVCVCVCVYNRPPILFAHASNVRPRMALLMLNTTPAVCDDHTHAHTTNHACTPLHLQHARDTRNYTNVLDFISPFISQRHIKTRAAC